MNLTIESRKRMHRTGDGTESDRKHCDVPGCNRSASTKVQLFPAHFDELCRIHAEEWGVIYDHALFGWPDEAEVAA